MKIKEGEEGKRKGEGRKSEGGERGRRRRGRPRLTLKIGFFFLLATNFSLY